MTVHPPPLPETWKPHLAHAPQARAWAIEVLALAETVSGARMPSIFATTSATATTADYLAMLDDRQVISDETADGDHELLAWVDAEPDRVFREATEDALDLMIRVSGESIEPTDGWWYHRVPKAGYIRDALFADAGDHRH